MGGKVTNFGSRTMLERPPAERSEITVRADGRGGRDRARQDEHPRVRVPGVDRQRRLRTDAQPVGARVVAGRLLRRLRRGPGGGPGPARDGDRRRGVDPDAGGVLRARRSQAHRGPDRAASDPVVARGLDPGTARAGRRGREAAAARDARAGAGRSVGGARVAVRRRDAEARPRDAALSGLRAAAAGGGRSRSARRSPRSNGTWVSPVEEIPTSSLFPSRGRHRRRVARRLVRHRRRSRSSSCSADRGSRRTCRVQRGLPRRRWSGRSGFTLDDYLAARHRRFVYTEDLDRLLDDDTVLVTADARVRGVARRRDAPRHRSPRRRRRATTPASST